MPKNDHLTPRNEKNSDSASNMLHFYPGMGATSSMYRAQWRAEFQGNYHNWLQWDGETSIPELAARLIDQHSIKEGDTVIGTSLGGIIACEISNQIPLSRIVLIGSATHKEEISRLLSALSPLIDLAPIAFTKAAAGKSPGDLADMFTESEPQFIKNMCKGIFKWDGLNNTVPIFRIHGSRDKVIPPPLQCDVLIDGGHLIVMTHPDKCIFAIKEICGAS